MTVAFLALALALAPADQGRDWAEALRVDATAMHNAIATSHPGPVNPGDPHFTARNDVQLERTLRRAENARNFADYFYAMQEYAASFDDGHLGYGVFGATPDEVRQWPGFLTRYDSQGQQFVFASEPWSGAPAGARLLSCDGLGANDVASKRIGSRVGRWNLTSQRMMFGAMTFLDTGNPYVGTVKRCQFQSKGRKLNLRLQWRTPEVNLYERYQIFPSRQKDSVEWRRLANGTQWFAIPSFDGNPESEIGKALRILIAELDAKGAEVRAAPAIVLDLRGNGGGSSDWSYKIATRIWGEGTIERHPEPPMTVSWRASQQNLESIRKSYAERSKDGHLSPSVTAWYEDTIAGLEEALAEGKALWVIRPNAAPAPVERSRLPVHELAGPVYVLTDSNCMSACLDAVDLWTRLGAIPIGQETGADTLYMEVRQVKLPAGVGAVSLPMKVYSGRGRGSNEPVVPRHRFAGDISDTLTIEPWVATLPKQRPRSATNQERVN